MAFKSKRRDLTKGRGKISETFLAFARPELPDDLDAAPQEDVENVLRVAYLVWNSAVLDRVRETTENLEQLRNQIAGHAEGSAGVERMIARKECKYGDDLRLIRRYEFRRKNGEPNLWAEAGDPYSMGR